MLRLVQNKPLSDEFLVAISKPLSMVGYAELLTGHIVAVVVGVGEEEIEFPIHQKLLNSVTNEFTGNATNNGPGNAIKRFELPNEDIKIFRMFIAWLYNDNRLNQLKAQRYGTRLLLSLYALSLNVKCESLKSDTTYALLAAMSENVSDFIQTIDFMFQKYPKDSDGFSNLQIMLDEMTDLACINLKNINILLDVFIRDELDDQERVFRFEQVKKVFDGTKQAGNGYQLRTLCLALVYYQRRWGEGQIKKAQHLTADQMARRFRGIEGFVDAYLRFEDYHKNAFPGEHPKDPRGRAGEMDTCFFHVHQAGESCTPSIEIDE